MNTRCENKNRGPAGWLSRKGACCQAEVQALRPTWRTDCCWLSSVPHILAVVCVCTHIKNQKTHNPNSPAFFLFSCHPSTHMCVLQKIRGIGQSQFSPAGPCVCFSPGSWGSALREQTTEAASSRGRCFRARAVSAWLLLTLPEGFHAFRMEGSTQEEPLPTVKSRREPQDFRGFYLKHA